MRRAMRAVPPARRPAHVGVVMDGNRRWARAAGHVNPSVGHRYGAEHVEDVLRWCVDWDIEHLTVYVLSADNIRKRAGAEIDYLMLLLETVVPQKVLGNGEWQLHVAGDLSLLPTTTAATLRDLVAQTASRPRHLTLAIGYDGRGDIVNGIRAALRQRAAAERPADGGSALSVLDIDDITASLGGGPVKGIDLVIRTSGEQRLSGFFPWQSARAELFLSPKMWPAFGEADFARAIRHFARHGHRRG